MAEVARPKKAAVTGMGVVVVKEEETTDVIASGKTDRATEVETITAQGEMHQRVSTDTAHPGHRPTTEIDDLLVRPVDTTKEVAEAAAVEAWTGTAADGEATIQRAREAEVPQQDAREVKGTILSEEGPSMPQCVLK